jgi:hypothetical protein
VASSDNTPAFQAAIDAATGAGGGVVTVPAGTWTLAGPLTVRASGVAIRGAGSGSTKLYFSAPDLDGASLTFAGEAAVSTDVPLVADAAQDQAVVRVADPAAFAPGDDVAIDWTISRAFIDAHGMAGVWDAEVNSALDERKTFFRREVVRIDGDALTLDVPLRYPALVRDAAAVRRDTGAIAECGVEGLSVANAVDETAALAAPRVHAIALSRVKDCFVRDVATFDPAAVPGDDHLRSGGIYVVDSKRVSVVDTSMAHAQHRGDGGAGYGFEVSRSSEVLFADDRAEDVRHGFIQNWDFGTSGVVFLRCTAVDDVAVNAGIGTPGRSELHHRLAMAVLFDGVHDTAGFAAYNRGDESSNAGHAGTRTVFWNVSGAGPDSRLSSYQFGQGWVIGTTGLTVLTVPDLLDAALGADAGTAPEDTVEGVDRGESLEPASLFDAQLALRVGI